MPRKQIQENLIRPELTNEEIQEFGQRLENWKLSAVMDCPLEYYGRPLNDQMKFNGFVINEIIGGVHWSVVDYAQKNNCIGKKNNGWFVVAEVLEKWQNGIVTTEAYTFFMRHLLALSNLKNKRSYAEKKNLEGLENTNFNEIIQNDLFRT